MRRHAAGRVDPQPRRDARASPGRRPPKEAQAWAFDPDAQAWTQAEGPNVTRPRRKKVFIKTFGCQMNEYDSDKMADVLHAAAGLRADQRRRGGRPDPVQHLLGAREGAGKGVQRPRPRQAPEGQGRADRRGRLRRQPGRRGHHRARALRGRGVRPADAAPPARDAARSATRSSGRRSTSAFPRSRSSTTCRRRGSTARPPSSRSWKAAPSTAATASCPTPAARRSSRPFDDVLAEVAGLADQGVKEVTLLGPERQRLPRHDGRRRGEIADFALLIEYVAEIPGIERIRYTTSHPNEFTQRLIDAYARVPQLVSHLHLPVQHGSDRILAAMKRGYTALEYKSTVRKLRAVRPGHRAVQRLHRRLPRRDRRRLRADDEADRRRRLRRQLQLHLQPAARHAGRGAARRHAARR